MTGKSSMNPKQTLGHGFCLVLPKEYEEHFNIHTNSGVISVETSFDRELMSSNIVNISIKVLT